MAEMKKGIIWPILLGGFGVMFLVCWLAAVIPLKGVDYSGVEPDESISDLDMSFTDAALIELCGDTAVAESRSVLIAQGSVKIREPGVYRLTGRLDDGMIYIEAAGDGVVQLILDDAAVTCADGPAIYVMQAAQVILTSAEGSVNTLTATASDGLESAVYSEADLVFGGKGALFITSENGIAVNGKSHVCFAGGSYTIQSKSSAVKASCGVEFIDGNIDIASGADAVKTTTGGRSYGKWLGAVMVKGGMVSIESERDGISAASVILVSGGELSLRCGGGSSELSVSAGFGMHGSGEMADDTDSSSAKGLKAETGICISGGKILIDCSDDAIHSDGDVTITGGELTLLTDDDGIHGDSTVNIAEGSIAIERCAEGVEAHYITIDGGSVGITASDDGMNAAAGSDPIAVLAKLMETELFGTGGRLILNGGDVRVISYGDGLDANGSIVQTGGNVYVCCLSSGADGALDYDGSYRFFGGTTAAFSSGGMMLQSPDTESDTACITVGAQIAAGSTVSVRDAEEQELISSISESDCSCMVLASDHLANGMQVTVWIDGTEVGTAEITDGTAVIGTVSSYRGGSGGSGEPQDSGDAASHEMSAGHGLRPLRIVILGLCAVSSAVILTILLRRRKKAKDDFA